MILQRLLAASLGLPCIAAAIRRTDCKSNTWLSLSPLPIPRQEHSTVAVNETTIAVIGGVVPRTPGLSWSTTDLLQFYDIPSDTWRTRAPIPIRVNHPNAVVKAGNVYLLGGLISHSAFANETVDWSASGQSYMYEPSTDTWTQLESMPSGTERGSAITGVYGDMIYVAAGMTTLQETYQDAVSIVTGFNTTSGSWQRLPPIAANIPSPRQHAIGGIHEDTLYVVGGRWFGQVYVRGEVYALNLQDLAAGWSTSAQNMPTPRGGLSGDIVGSKWYTFGGEGDPMTYDGVFPNSEAFDIQTQEWTELRAMAVPRHGTHAVAIGNKVYIPGGGLQQDGKMVHRNGTTTIGQTTAHFDAYCV